MHSSKRTNGEGRFKKLCALAQSNSLSMADQVALKEHLKICGSCREAYVQYAAIGGEGVAILLVTCGRSEEADRWDDREARQRLIASIRSHKGDDTQASSVGQKSFEWRTSID